MTRFLFDNVNLACVDGDAGYGLRVAAALLVEDGHITWLGARADCPAEQGVERHDFGGRLLTPGLIDCHTHLVYAGDRAGEFEQRLEGASYAEIAAAGGGILSTVRATRAASEAELLATAQQRVRALLDDGVTTLEIKSGYGLDVDSELKMLRVARRLGQDFDVRVTTTFLGAHALPPEYVDRADDYIDLVCKQR